MKLKIRSFSILIFFIHSFLYPNPGSLIANLVNHRYTGKPQKISSLNFQKIHSGIYLKTLTYSRAVSLEDIKLHILRVNRKNFSNLVLLSNKELLGPKEFCQENNLIFALNSCFFDTRQKPLGILVRENRKFSSLKRGNLPVFYLKNNNAQILSSNEFLRELKTSPDSLKTIKFAFQSWPQLIPHQTIGFPKLDEARRRSLIGIDQKGNLYLLWTDSLFSGFTFREIEEICKTENFNFSKLLNLDGGKSTQAYLQTKKTVIHTRGLEKVPVFIGIRK